MKHLKSRAAVRWALAAGANPRLAVAALALIEDMEEATGGDWAPERHGWVVLVETPADLTDRARLRLGGASLLEAPRAAVEHLSELGCYAVVVPGGTTFGLTCVVPETLLPPSFRPSLDADARRLSQARPALTLPLPSAR